MFITAEAQGAGPPITSSGLNTQVSAPIVSGSGSTQTTQYDITGGTRPGGAAGTNLFHSFDNFNVPTNNIANFLNQGSVDLNGASLPLNLPTSNILGRVTAGNPSVIFGMIQTNGPGGFGNANLFLMNPAGFLFGPNATVNIGGMVAFTTADYLRLSNGVLFNNTPSVAQDALLSAAPVAAFGFLGSNPAAIAIQGSTLKVAEGQSLSFVGGNHGFMYTDPDTGNTAAAPVPGGVTVSGGKLLAPGGQINLASVASPGEVLYPSFNYGPNVNGAQFTSLGNISLSDGALVDVSANQAGAVKIRGGQLMIADATVSAVTENANGTLVAIDINIAGDMSIAQTTSAPALTARTTGIGDAGEIRISSRNLTVTSTGTDVPTVAIDTHTSGEGRAGNVKITTGNLDVSSSSLAPAIFIDSGTVGFHNAHGGDVTITSTRFNDTAQGIGTGGNLNRIQGGDTDGSSGNLTITANEIQLTGVFIVTDVGNAGAGVAGNLTLDASNITTVGSVVSATGWQQGGTITIHANNLSITDSSSIGTLGLTGPSGQ
jgi:filamentous hemagglutinin family protein